MLFALALAAVGCGNQNGAPADEKPSSFAVEHGETIHDCLLASGVTFATSPRDIGFYWKARRSGEAARVGFAYDEPEDLDAWLVIPRKEGPKKWMLWYSRPPSSPLSIFEMVRRWEHWYTLPPTDPRKNHGDFLHRAYVVYKIGPNAGFRREARRCVPYSAPGDRE